MANLSEKSSTSFTFEKNSAPTSFRSHTWGKVESFIFVDVKSWSEQGTIMVAKSCREEVER
jgi:hypothetical protein